LSGVFRKLSFLLRVVFSLNMFAKRLLSAKHIVVFHGILHCLHLITARRFCLAAQIACLLDLLNRVSGKVAANEVLQVFY